MRENWKNHHRLTLFIAMKIVGNAIIGWINAENRYVLCAKWKIIFCFFSVFFGAEHGHEKYVRKTLGMFSDVMCRCLYRVVIFM